MRILKPFMLLAVIGVLYSCAAVPLQTYRNGYIMDKNNVVVGYYSNGHVLDLEKNIIGYYANGYIYDTRHEVRKLCKWIYKEPEIKIGLM